LLILSTALNSGVILSVRLVQLKDTQPGFIVFVGREQLEFLNTIYDSYIVLIQKSSLIKASEESEKMDKLLEKIKSSPRLTRQPQNPIRQDEEIGFTIE
jgi:hypothetical protein